MSLLNLMDFNGSVKRNRAQDAMLSTFNEKERFLRRLEEERIARAKETAEKGAATTIQRVYRQHRQRRAALNELRRKFDAITGTSIKEIDTQLGCLAFFYESRVEGDDSRMVSVCGKALVAARGQSEPFKRSRRQLALAAILRFFNKCGRETNFTMPLRFIQEFSDAEDYTYLIKKGYFASMLTLIALAIPISDGPLAREDLLPPRRQFLCDQLLVPFDKCNDQNTKRRFISRLLHSVMEHKDSIAMSTVVVPLLLNSIGSKWTFNHLASAVDTCYCMSQNEKMPSRVLVYLVSQLVSVSLTEDDKSREQTLVLLSRVVPPLIVPSTSKDHKDGEPMEVDQTVDNKFDLFVNSEVERVLKGNDFYRLCLAIEDSCSQEVFNALIAFENRIATSNILHAIAASNKFITRLFHCLTEMGDDVQNNGSFVDQVKRGSAPNVRARARLIPALGLYCHVAATRARSLSDDATKEDCSPLMSGTRLIRDVCLGLIDLSFPQELPSSHAVVEQRRKEAAEWSEIYEVVVHTLKAIHSKDERIKFLPQNFWNDHNRQVVVRRNTWTQRVAPISRGNAAGASGPSAFLRVLRDGGGRGGGGRSDTPTSSDSESDTDDVLADTNVSSNDMRNLSIIRSIPFIVPFQHRLKIFGELLTFDKSERRRRYPQGGDPWDMELRTGGGPRRGDIRLSVRRDYLYEDAFKELTPAKYADMRQPVRVRMINAAGMSEDGQDGGGIFREFITELLKTGFDPSRGLFCYTADRQLYPNPQARHLYPDFSQHFYFLGRMLARLLYESQLLDVHFADFFLVQLLGCGTPTIDLEHMKSYDPIIYKHLRSLRNMSATEIANLELDFSVVVDNMGAVKTVDLKADGRSVRVTAENREEYVQLYVNYFLFHRIGGMVDAMRAGVNDVVDTQWLAMFAPSELQMIVSGTDTPIDVQGMRSYCPTLNIQDVSDEQYVDQFWQVVHDMHEDDRRLLLKFITGCPRPPLEGFKALYPAMGIQLVRDGTSLPSSATCMNLLRLPVYSSRQILQEKIRYAINAGAGFEMP